LITVRAILLGLLAVLLTAVLAIVVAIIVLQVRWRLSSESKLSGMSFGIDVVSIVKNSLLTPVGFAVAVVIFVVVLLLSRRLGVP
jgi:hypothetical protein